MKKYLFFAKVSHLLLQKTRKEQLNRKLFSEKCVLTSEYKFTFPLCV